MADAPVEGTGDTAILAVRLAGLEARVTLKPKGHGRPQRGDHVQTNRSPTSFSDSAHRRSALAGSRA